MKFIATFFFAALASLAHAQPFPHRPVTLIVPFSPGTGIDILARVIAPKLSEKWAQAVVVENKPGASGNIGTDFVAKAPPDGYQDPRRHRHAALAAISRGADLSRAGPRLHGRCRRLVCGDRPGQARARAPRPRARLRNSRRSSSPTCRAGRR